MNATPNVLAEAVEIALRNGNTIQAEIMDVTEDGCGLYIRRLSGGRKEVLSFGWSQRDISMVAPLGNKVYHYANGAGSRQNVPTADQQDRRNRMLNQRYNRHPVSYGSPYHILQKQGRLI